MMEVINQAPSTTESPLSATDGTGTSASAASGNSFASAVGNVEVIDVDDYPDDNRSTSRFGIAACGPQDTSGIRFVCVDPQCPKHKAARRRPKDLGTIDLCLSSDDEDHIQDTTALNSSSTQAAPATPQEITSTPNIDVIPLTPVANTFADTVPAAAMNVESPSLTSNFQSSNITTGTVIDNNIELSVNTMAQHNGTQILRTNENCASRNDQENSKAEETRATPNSNMSPFTHAVTLPRSPPLVTAVHGIEIKSEVTSPPRCPVHPDVKIYNENVTFSNADAEQLRDQTKLGRNIVDKYYDILVKQPIVQLEPVNLKHVLDKSLLESLRNKNDDVKKHCPFCNKKFVFEKSLVYHVNMYHQKTAMPYRCAECDMGFFKSVSLKIHMQRKHNESNSLAECNVCHKFYRKSFLARHIKNKHTEKKPVMCEQCGTVVSTATDLIYHKKIFHEKKKKGQGGIRSDTNRCQKCSSILSVDNTCKLCAKNIVQSPNKQPPTEVSSLYLDTRTTDMTLNCPKCSSVFTSEEGRDRHYRANHDEKTMSFHCKLCLKGFLNESVMSSHMIYIHRRSMTKSVAPAIRPMLRDILRKQKNNEVFPKGDGEDKTVCPLCKGKFFHQRFRDAHFRDIHGEDKMPYHCDVCQKGYFQLLVVLKHYRLSHPVDFKNISGSLDDEEVQTGRTKEINEVVLEPDEHDNSVLVRSGHLACPICGKMFGELTKRDKHYRRVHNESKMPFKCSKCNTGYLCEMSLRCHKESYCKYKQVRAMMTPAHTTTQPNKEPVLNAKQYSSKSPTQKQTSKSPLPETVNSITYPSRSKKPVAGSTVLGDFETRVWRSRPDSPTLDEEDEATQPITEKPVCEVCGKVFLTIHGLNWHVKEKHPQPNNITQVRNNGHQQEFMDIAEPRSSSNGDDELKHEVLFKFGSKFVMSVPN